MFITDFTVKTMKAVAVWNEKCSFFPDNFELISVFTSTLYILRCVCEHACGFDFFMPS